MSEKFKCVKEGPEYYGLTTAVLYMHGTTPDYAEFKRESDKFCEYHHVPASNVFAVMAAQDNESRRSTTIDAIRKVRNCDRLVYFGHGWKTGCQLGWNINNCWELVQKFSEIWHNGDGRLDPCRIPITVVLYACSTAEGKTDLDDSVGTQGGFADRLRDCLRARGIRGEVIAHRTAGHTGWNPYLVRLSTEGPTHWFVKPFQPEWKKWIKRLKTQFRFQVPFLEKETVKIFLAMPDDEFSVLFKEC
jgi:hypothetical protein